MISFVMEKCLILPMCVCVQYTPSQKKKKKNALRFMSNRFSLESFKQHM